MLARSLVSSVRNFTTTAVRRGGHSFEPPPLGYTVPLPIGNKFKMTTIFCVFFGSGFGLPFYVVMHQLKKAQG